MQVSSDKYAHLPKKENLKAHSISEKLKFFIPSILGILFFIVPITLDGNTTIPIAWVSGKITQSLGAYAEFFYLIFLCCTTLASVAINTSSTVTQPKSLKKFFDTSPIMLLMQVLGCLFFICVVFGIGPDCIIAENTGGFVLHELVIFIGANLLVALIFLPFFTNFGLLEFVSTFMQKIMRPLFKLPGRSAIDCITSWVSDCTVGVMLTSKQYEGNYYTAKEAAIIATTFSAISITSCFVILIQLNIEHMFALFYAVVVLCGFTCAIIVPNLPPLSRKPHVYLDGSSAKIQESDHAGSIYHQALYAAVERANAQPQYHTIVQSGFLSGLQAMIQILPILMCVATLGTVLAEYTPVFQWLGAPFVPLLEWMHIPEAEKAAPCLLVGFAEVFLPATFAMHIESEMTRFIIACLSIAQVIFLSEMGAILLGSKIPIKLIDLVILFLMRTLISLPIIVVCAHWIY